MAQQGRIELMDILRGVAILGTLGTNIWIFAHLGDLNYVFSAGLNPWWTSADAFIRVLVLFFVNGKFLSMLAIMFGVGLQLKYKQSLRKGSTWPGLYVWTSFILLVEGVLHFTFVMEYDILMSYAVTAVIVAFIVRSGDRAIRRAMFLFGSWHGLMVVLIMAGMAYIYWMGGSISMGDMSQVAALYRDGTWLEQIQYRLSDFWVLRLEVIFVIPLNVFLFLVGVRLMRGGAFAADENGRRIRRRMLRVGLGIGLPLNLLIFVPGGWFDLWVRYVSAPILAVGYMALIARMVDWKSRSRVWTGVGKIGKMALSCYVLQNVICSLLFYGWGLGLGGHISSIGTVMIWLFVSMVQLGFAALWLRYFRFGPLEGVRRSLAKLPAESMQKPSV